MKAKKFFVVGSLAAVILSSSTALALGGTVYTNSGIWSRGTTGLFGGGDVYSHYYDYQHTYSYASVKNAKGATDSDTQKWATAKAQVKAYNWPRTDYAYYNYWD